jgi:hypothetical protein
MAKSASTKEIELHPDAWQRFERAAGVVAKSPPQHRIAKKKTILGKVETKPTKAKSLKKKPGK